MKDTQLVAKVDFTAYQLEFAVGLLALISADAASCCQYPSQRFPRTPNQGHSYQTWQVWHDTEQNATAVPSWALNCGRLVTCSMHTTYVGKVLEKYQTPTASCSDAMLTSILANVSTFAEKVRLFALATKDTAEPRRDAEVAGVNRRDDGALNAPEVVLAD